VLAETISLRHLLRENTSAAHAALEARVGLLNTQTEYNEYVRGLHAFRLNAETWLATQGSHGEHEWRPHNISDQLDKDIADLALTTVAVHPVDWDATIGKSFAMGVHYVLEGSALGARVLCKRVASLGMHRTHGARHLWAQAESDSWRAFLGALLQHERRTDRTALIAGANAAFLNAAACMERAAHG